MAAKDDFDPRSIGAMPVNEDFDPESIGAVAVSKSSPAKQSILDQVKNFDWKTLGKNLGLGFTDPSVGAGKALTRHTLELGNTLRETPVIGPVLKAISPDPIVGVNPQAAARIAAAGGPKVQSDTRSPIFTPEGQKAIGLEDSNFGQKMGDVIESGAEFLLPGKMATVPNRLFQAARMGTGMGAIGAGQGAPLLSAAMGAAEPYVGPLINKAVTKPLAHLAARFFRGGPEVMNEPIIGQGPVIGTATPAELASLARERGINLRPAEALESGIPDRPNAFRSVQSVGERSNFGGQDLRQETVQNHENFLTALDDFKDRLAPTEQFPDRTAIGANLKGQTEAAMQRLKQSAAEDFDAWTNLTQDNGIDTSAYQQKWKEEAARLQNAIANAPGSKAARIQDLLNKAKNLGTPSNIPQEVEVGGKMMRVSEMNPFMRDMVLESLKKNPIADIKLAKTTLPEITAKDAQFLRTELYDIAHDFSGNWGTQGNAIASRMVSDMDHMIEMNAEKNGTTELWRSANAKWKLAEELYNKPGSSPLARIIKGNEETAPGMLSVKGNIKGSPRAIEMARSQNLDLNPLKRQVVDNIAETGFRLKGRTGKELGGYSHEYLASLFNNPGELEELYNMGRIGRAIGFELNPSGTSNVLLANKEIGNVARAPGALSQAKFGQAIDYLAGPLSARFTMNPTIREAATGIPASPIPLIRRTRFTLPPRNIVRAGAAVGQNRFINDMRDAGY